MSVTNGQPANQNTFNTAFMSKTTNTGTSGQIVSTNSTNTTGAGTGAIQTAGGVYIAQDLIVGGSISGNHLSGEVNSQVGAVILTHSAGKNFIRCPITVTALNGIVAPTTDLFELNVLFGTTTLLNSNIGGAEKLLLPANKKFLATVGEVVKFIYDMSAGGWRVQKSIINAIKQISFNMYNATSGTLFQGGTYVTDGSYILDNVYFSTQRAAGLNAVGTIVCGIQKRSILDVTTNLLTTNAIFDHNVVMSSKWAGSNGLKSAATHTAPVIGAVTINQNEQIEMTFTKSIANAYHFSCNAEIIRIG